MLSEADTCVQSGMLASSDTGQFSQPNARLDIAEWCTRHMTGGFPGGQSEYVRVPFGEVNCLKVPSGVSGEHAP